MRLAFILVIGALVRLGIASKILKRWDDVAEKHGWVDIPQGWEHHSPAPKGYMLDLRVGLKHHGIEELIENLMEISDPGHERYGQHLSKDEAEALVAPHPSSLPSVSDWLSYHSIPSSSITQSTGGGLWLTLRISVEQAEKLLSAKYNIYRHSALGVETVRTLSYSLPKELHEHVGVVAPTTYFSTLRTMRATSFLQPEIHATNDTRGSADVSSSCADKITPDCLRNLYRSADYVPRAVNVNKLGVTGYLGQFASFSDLQTFFSRFRPEAKDSSFTAQLAHGGRNDQNQPAGVEANLDIQYTTSMSFPTPNIFYSTGGSPPFNADSATPTNTNEPYLDFFQFLLSQDMIPQVLSTSYGDNEQTVPKDYALTVCNMLAQLGSMGTTALFSSGDFGVGIGDCQMNDGTNRVLFQPSFPASCPFVTTVGGTTGIKPEVAIDFSGGGFSRYFPQPRYQSAAVNAFLIAEGNKLNGMYHKQGRAYPDVAAQASGYQVIVNGETVSVGGTSASAPTVAGIFSLLNDLRISQGKPSLGFINPLLYSTAATGFNDIISGSNPGCGTQGFSARRGWDPVTGLGTPDFERLRLLV